MKTNNNIKIGLWVTVLLLFARCAWAMPSGPYGFCSAAGEAIFISLMLLIIYDKWLWRYNPLEKKPRLLKHYIGQIGYKFQGLEASKVIDVSVKQTRSSVSIRIITNEIISQTITSQLIEERGEYVLYYTYITNPKNYKRGDNPIQYGSCRIVFCDNTEIRGIYWTTQNTTGDILFIVPSNLSTPRRGIAAL